MGACLAILVRGVTVAALLAGSLAITVARIVPHSERVRTPCAVRYTAINGHFFEPGQPTTRILDLETGRISSLALPKGERIQWASFSDWVDEDGDRHIVGRWSKLGGEGDRTVCLGTGLVRIGYPSGRVLDRITDFQMIPSGPPCWYPGSSARVLYSAADGHLYQYAFDSCEGADTPSSEDGALPIVWDNDQDSRNGLWIHEVCWPKDPRFQGRLFASVSTCGTAGSEVVHGPARIWWLEMSRDGRTVAASGPLAIDDSDVSPDCEQRFPCVSLLPDGSPILAYHERLPGERASDARIARIEFDPQTRIPLFRPAKSVRIASLCKSVPAAFAPKGDRLFLLHWNESGQPGLMPYPLRDLLTDAASSSHPL